jgi:hypothetical protein
MIRSLGAAILVLGLICSFAHAQGLERDLGYSLRHEGPLPPHVVEVAYGLYSCERGYFLKEGRCIADADLPRGPIVEMSSVPSAGDGAPGGCPSGGCRSYFYARTYGFGGYSAGSGSRDWRHSPYSAHGAWHRRGSFGGGGSRWRGR